MAEKTAQPKLRPKLKLQPKRTPKQRQKARAGAKYKKPKVDPNKRVPLKHPLVDPLIDYMEVDPYKKSSGISPIIAGVLVGYLRKEAQELDKTIPGALAEFEKEARDLPMSMAIPGLVGAGVGGVGGGILGRLLAKKLTEDSGTFAKILANLVAIPGGAIGGASLLGQLGMAPGAIAQGGF
jgi:hypothetical protein